MYGMFEDEDDVFMGSPKSKFMDVVFNANNDVVRHELENFIEKFATMELMLEEHVSEDIDQQIKTFMYSNQDDVETKSKSIYIELMGTILSQSE
ncbi:protein of unknown function [Epsilonproteobacteria bacterium SCGC AD-311-C15]|jgi:hypothetical protein|nr:protein of unknown function [Epsilonproteobacteria bacterium SCGC AD-311-C15]